MNKKLLFLFTLLFFISCAQQDREIAIINQETAIDKYIAGFSENRVVRNGGSNRIVIAEGDSADSLEFGDSLSFYYAGHIFSNAPGPLFSTNNEVVAAAASFSLTAPNFDPIKIIFEKDSFTAGLRNGLLGMKENEYSYIVFSAKYGFNNSKVYNIPKLSPLLYEIWIEKITKI